MTTLHDPIGQLGPMGYQTLAVLLRKLREAMKLRQEDLADKSPVTTRTIKRIEKGEKPVRPYHLEGVCRALGFELKSELQYTLIPIKNQPLLDESSESNKNPNV